MYHLIQSPGSLLLRSSIRNVKNNSSSKSFPSLEQRTIGSTAKRIRSIRQDRYKRNIIRRVIRPKDRRPERSWITAKLQKIVAPIVPKTVTPLPDIKPVIQSTKTNKAKAEKVGSDLWNWIKDNAGTIILNAGSICTLTAFTRSDILELRVLSMTGSISSVVYFLSLPTPRVYFPAVWSSIFALTNAYKVFFILQERNGKAKNLTSDEKDVFEQYFMPHGVTPKQFEKLILMAKEIEVKKGEVLVENGEKLDAVYLVKSGSIDGVANMKRRVTAASKDRDTSRGMPGGDSGAWIGELRFLDKLAMKDVKKRKIYKPPPPTVEVEGTDATSKSKEITLAPTATTPQPDVEVRPPSATKKAILTYVATEDSTVYVFDNQELYKLLGTSNELRSAVTRAMTAAVVGKVVNLYLSKVDAEKSFWQKWLEDA
jgi:CRP-like cAMP-binding protein